MALRDLCNVVDEIRLDAQRRRQADHSVKLRVVEGSVDEGHDRSEANRFGGEIGFCRQRLEFLRARWRQSGKVRRELDLEDVTRGRNDAGAIRRRGGRSRCRDRAHRLENGLRLCGSGVDVHEYLRSFDGCREYHDRSDTSDLFQPQRVYTDSVC